MQRKLRLLLIAERIFSIVTCLTVRFFHYPNLSPSYTHICNQVIDNNFTSGPNGRCSGYNVHIIINGHRTPSIGHLDPTIFFCPWSADRTPTILLRRFNLDIAATDVPSGPPPWYLPTTEVIFPPISKSDFHSLQWQLAQKRITTVISSNKAPHSFCGDGSFQLDAAAGSAVFSPDLVPPTGG